MIFASFAVALFFATVAVLTARAGIKRIIVRFVARIGPRVKARIAKEIVLAETTPNILPTSFGRFVDLFFFFTGGFICQGPALAIWQAGGTLVLFLSLRGRLALLVRTSKSARTDRDGKILVEAQFHFAQRHREGRQDAISGPSPPKCRVLSQLRRTHA